MCLIFDCKDLLVLCECVCVLCYCQVTKSLTCVDMIEMPMRFKMRKKSNNSKKTFLRYFEILNTKIRKIMRRFEVFTRFRQINP